MTTTTTTTATTTATTAPAVARAFAAVGHGALRGLGAVGRVVLFFAASMLGALRERGGVRAAAQQALVLTSRCALPVALVCGPIGAMLSLQALTLIRTFGTERQLAPLAAAIVIRELAPGFCAVVVAMQGGAAIAAELATMRLAEEIDALEVMGLNTRALLAGPRMLGAALAGPLLNALAIVVGITGAYLMAVLVMGVPHADFVEGIADGVSVNDVVISEAKTVFFGLGLGTLCASAGFHSVRSTDGVGAAANNAVVASVIFVLVANYLLNTAVFGLRGGMHL